MIAIGYFTISCLLLLGYTWLVYPLMLAAFARLCGRPVTEDVADEEKALPFLHIILSAYNEEPVIGARLQNLVGLDYPADRLAIRIGTDGCSDKTVGIIKEFWEEGVRNRRWTQMNADGGLGVSLYLYEYAENRGKPAVLKDLVASALDIDKRTECTNSLLVFTDANTYYAPDALHQLAKPFSDPNVGGVCGRVILHDRGIDAPQLSASNPQLPAPEGSYWEFETKLKIWESSLDSCLGANGPIYAIRPELFWSELPHNTVVDDLVIAMKVREQGKRMIFEPKALSYEELPETKDEWWRRVRIGSGDYQAISFCRPCLLPSYGWFAWAFWSHKVLRWFTPHLMLLTAISALSGSVGSRIPFQLSAFIPQLSLCDIVSVGSLIAVLLWGLARLFSAFSFQLSAFSLIDHFFTMQLALFRGFIRFCSGELKGSWRRTPR